MIPCSIVTPSRIVPIHCYMNLRYMRSTIGALASNNARVLNVSNITDRIEKLSLFDDSGEASSSNSNIVTRRIPRTLPFSRTKHIHIHHYPRSVISSHMSQICNYMNNIQTPARLKEIIKTTHNPVMTGLIDRLFENPRTTFMGLGYRFKPGQSDFIMHDLRLPASLKASYTLWKDSLGLSMSKKMLSVRELCKFSHQDGIKSVLDVNYYKNLVEVITLFNGTFGRFLILTCTGLGCTVWYSFFPCIDGQIPTELFTPIVTYDPFFNMDYLSPSFNCVEFTAASDISEQINSAYSKIPPLSEIGIPASGVVLRNVGLGLIIAFLITTGVVDISNVMNNV